MSYAIEPMPLISFLDENKLRLPRFQRKATWDKKQNFELAISVFQDYPVGVVIVNQEQKISWLLDGRQRRTALLTMRDNPVALYEWARSYIKFAKTADPLDVTKAYWGQVDRYLRAEEGDEPGNDDAVQYEDEDTDYISANEEDSFDSVRQRQGLQTLLDIILMVHQNKPSGSRWEHAFDFRKYIPRLKYAPKRNNSKIDPVILRRFILEFLKAVEQENSGERTKEFFISYYDETFDITDRKKFEKEVDMNWRDISNSLDVIDRSEKIFKDARIGWIKLTNASPLDAQNIFSRVNRGGTQLKAEELLSAKPYWNKVVSTVDPVTTDHIRDMYKKLDIPAPETVVRWDIAATFISRIKDENLFFDSYMDAKKKGEVSLDEISLGFKLLSSVYENGMSIKHINELEKNDQLNWDYDIDERIEELNTVCHIILADKFFKYYQSWNRPTTKLLGNAIALEFLTIMWLDWKEKGSPYTVSGETKALQRDARILFDKFVFEYATKTWRGSGDSKMSNDIKNWKSRIVPVDPANWQNFIDGACKGSYNGQETTVKLLRPVIYYYYVLTHCAPINQIEATFDVDHIIPKEKFVGNSMISQSWRDSLINLALLPTKENISKKSKALNEITDPWLKLQITTYTGIKADDFDYYSDVSHLLDLYKTRSASFKSSFGAERLSILSE